MIPIAQRQSLAPQVPPVSFARHISTRELTND